MSRFSDNLLSEIPTTYVVGKLEAANKKKFISLQRQILCSEMKKENHIHIS